MNEADRERQEELAFGTGPKLWDADPEVCCAAFQLGACVHTEAGADESDALEDNYNEEETDEEV